MQIIVKCPNCGTRTMAKINSEEVSSLLSTQVKECQKCESKIKIKIEVEVKVVDGVKAKS